MRRVTALILTWAGLIGLGVLGSGTANAESLTFRIQSKYQYKVQIEFYSQARNAAWPGDNEAYNLNDSGVHEYNLSCQAGEKICYGAWVSGNQNTFWGAGLHARQSCASCCYTCDGSETPIIVLNNSSGDDDDDGD